MMWRIKVRVQHQDLSCNRREGRSGEKCATNPLACWDPVSNDVDYRIYSI